MEVVLPDILADVRQLSAILLVAALAVGAALWLAGWWSHRFWVVLAITVLGGIWGLQNAAVVLTQPLVAAIGIGLAAGILALTLIRLGAFVAGGYAGIWVIHSMLPAWDQPLLSFLAGGFLGFFLLRYWVMALTSIAGVGAVGKPGFYMVPSDMLLTDVLMMAGGPASTASLDKVKIKRAKEVIWDGDRLREAMIEGRTLDQLSVRAGDAIDVPAAQGKLPAIRSVMMGVGSVASFVFLLRRAGIL
jgi:hypothetical protein